MKDQKLKVYKLQIKEDADDITGVSVISLVKSPAIMKNFVAFSSEEIKQFKFAVTDKVKQIVTGPIMIADMPIYRKETDDTGAVTEFYVVADKPTISAVIQKFFKTQRTANASLEHNGCLLNGVYIMESFQVDKDRGILSPQGYGTITDGSWFGSMKIENADIWNEIENGSFKGFSIEGLFGYADTSATIINKSDMQVYSELYEIINNL